MGQFRVALAGLSTVLLFACSASTGAKRSSGCSAAQVNQKQQNVSSLQLSPLSAVDDKRLGIAYLDITTNTAGVEQTRRCTASLHPVNDKPDHINIMTAQHCSWDADTEEFANSKYTLRVWYKDGYFPVDTEMIGQADWSTFARTIKPYLSYFSERMRSRFSQNTSGAAMNECLSLTNDVQNKNPNGKDILCFSSEETRKLLARISVADKHRSKLETVVAIVQKRQNSALENLPEPEKSIFRYHANRPSAFDKLPAYLTSLGFSMNTYFCSTTESDGPFELDGRPEKRDICQMKPLITSLLQSNSPQHFKVVNEVAEKAFTNPAEMQDFYNNYIRCSFASLDDIAAGQFKTPTSLCDKDYFAWKVWLKWGKNGLQQMNNIEIKDRRLKGFNESSYYVLHTNSLGSSEAAISGDSSKSSSRFHEINRQFGEIFTKNNALAFLFDPKETDIWITKKDSGSLLNVFGVFPAAVISTYNGEPTSGGASILPLPEPTEEQAPTAGGC